MARLRALVFAAHPDDIEFGAGGTVLRLREHCDLTLCTLTDGGAGSHGTPATREAEQRKAAALLGASLRWLGHRDCSVEYTRNAALMLAQIIRDEKPDIVLCPHWDQTGGVNDTQAHPDHRHLGLLIRDAVRFARFRIPELTGDAHCAQQLWYYMVPAARKAALVIPIDDLIPELRKLWACHESQLALRDNHIEEYLLARRAVSAGQLRNVRYAELVDSDAPIPVDLITKLFS